MFTRVFPNFQRKVSELLHEVRCPSETRTAELLQASLSRPLELPELAELLEIGVDPQAAPQFEALRSFTASQFRKPEGNYVRYIAPIYLSSFCVDLCGYCNFSAARKNTARRRLSLNEFEAELLDVLAAGARVVELVLGTDPEMPWQNLVPYISLTAERLGGEAGSGVLLCSDYLSTEAYAALREAGLSGMVQWDETLDPEAYRRWHDASLRKRHFEARVDNHDRAMMAGLEVAAGALFGLADIRYEALMQIVKVRYLRQEYGRKPFVFGAARVKPIGEQTLPSKVAATDRAFESALMVYKIAEPEIGRWLQTRETLELNLRNVLDGDAFTYRCGEVRPGGYGAGGNHQPASIAGQFRVHELDAGTAVASLRAIGFRIEYAWMQSSVHRPCVTAPRG